MWIKGLFWDKLLRNPDPEGAGGAPVSDPTPSYENNVPDAPAGRDETADFALDAFDGMSRDYDEMDELEAPAEATPPVSQGSGSEAQTGAQAPGQQQPVAAPAQQGQAVPPVSGTAQPPTAAPGDQQQPSAAESPDQIFSKLQGMIEENRQAFTEALAQRAYSLSEQEIEQFHENPAKVISNIAARVQVQTTEALMKVFSQQMPVYVNGLVAAQAKNQEAENKFWGSNPGLNRNEHGEIVKSIAAWYRSQNPKASEEEFTKVVGNMAMARLGLTHHAVQQAAATQVPRQGNPSLASIQTPGRVVRQVSPPPPVGGMHGAPPSAQPPAVMNEWDRISRMMDTYDD